MVEKSEIQIFVSCPGDVEAEKKIVENVCKTLNESIDNRCKILFRVKEWRSIMGQFGIRIQDIINNKIGSYDIYLGIWWMRFGSKTGAINPETNEEFPSGTYEEFNLAYKQWLTNKTPDIFLLFKKYRAPKDDEIDQLAKVKDFKIEQASNGWIHDFESELEFQSKVYQILLDKMLTICLSKNVTEINTLLSLKSEINIYQYKGKFSTTKSYVSRSLLHYTVFKDLTSMFHLKDSYENLESLISKKNRIILLGDAGSGKSTELKRLASILDKPNTPFLPIYQTLSHYTPTSGLEYFLPEYWKNIPDHLLVIIWDGLDEIHQKDFNSAIRQITTFSDKHPEIRLIISCRTNFYNLPTNSTNGTLQNFEPYFLSNISLSDAKEYYATNYQSIKAESFIREILENKLDELITRPYFLMLVADIFSKNNKLSISRSNLFESYIMSRIENDYHHLQNISDTKYDKNKILKLHEYIALGLEIFAKNNISESELLNLIPIDQYTILKNSTIFKKQNGSDDFWQFEHNNLQEYLAAKSLSTLSFKDIKAFITFKTNRNKLIPSWTNTLTFLISLLEPSSSVFNTLLNWLSKYQKEAIIKFEKEKIDENIRIRLFKSIFSQYKKYNVWISSNMFTIEDLAKFGQSDVIIKFLFNEITKKSNTIITKINSFNLLGFLQIDPTDKSKLKNIALREIDNNSSNKDYIYSIIYSLKRAKIDDPNTVNELMERLKERNNQYIRAAMYAILSSSGLIDNYIDYLIEGALLNNKKEVVDDRGEISLVDESWNIRICFEEVKSPEGIKKIVSNFENTSRIALGYDEKNILSKIIQNASTAFHSDNSVFDTMLSWYISLIKQYETDISKIVLNFFDITSRREEAFERVLSINLEKKDINIVISSLLNENLIDRLVQMYITHDLTNDDVKDIYWSMQWLKNPSYSIFESVFERKTEFRFIKQPIINYEEIWKKRRQYDIDLLFDQTKFRDSVTQIFDQENNMSLSHSDLFDIRRDGNNLVNWEDNYPDIALRLLRDFVTDSTTVTKEMILGWFLKSEDVEFYCISNIFEYLSNHSDLILSSSQSEYIIDWSKKNAKEVDFKKAISHFHERRITYKTKAIHISYFTKLLSINHEENILLDMLSFDCHIGHDWLGIEYIIKQLEPTKVMKRIVKNLEDGLEDYQVFKNHVSYALTNNISESFVYIRNEIINNYRADYNRQELADLYFEKTNDIDGLKGILQNADIGIRWKIIGLVYTNDSDKKISNYLFSVLKNEIDPRETLKALECLIKMQDVEGLNGLIKWLKSQKLQEFENHSLAFSLALMKSSDAIPYLLEILEMVYKGEIVVSKFDRLDSGILDALFKIAMDNEANFIKVKQSLNEFIAKNINTYKNINFLFLTVERLENQFYMNKAQSYSVIEVKEKLALISDNGFL